MSESEHAPVAHKQSRGGRNLIILGVLAIIVASISTGISLWIYRQNDIYLDRSRPGYIAEGEKNEDDAIEKFSEEGVINEASIDQYLEELDYVIEKVHGLSSAFNSGPLEDGNFLFDSEEEDSEQASSLEDAS